MIITVTLMNEEQSSSFWKPVLTDVCFFMMDTQAAKYERKVVR